MSGADDLALALFAEVLAVEQLARTAAGRALPKGMELSQLLVLDHLARAAGERTPAGIAATFRLSRAALTNTLRKLEAAGHVHVRPDWDDARRKLVAISPAGRAARDAALAAVSPALTGALGGIDPDRARGALSVLRGLRMGLDG
ncbi:MAG: MarR family winged helix-turn-helix transcriptional regulator [Paracoccaceae bacterium]